MPTVAPTALVTSLTRYAERFHARCGDNHHIASPLGAWILLALCAPASAGRLRDEIQAVLGVDPDEAAAFAADLLTTKHPAVALAAAIWTSPRTNTERFIAFLTSLPFSIERGPIPLQAQVDEWARKNTFGLIQEFPVQPHGDALLATAIATKVLWMRPFKLVSATQLGARSPWAVQVRRCLGATGSDVHRQFIAMTDRAGDVAVHSAVAKGLVVTSVIASPDVASADVLAAAYQLAGQIARGDDVRRQSLFDLPLGDRPMWSISEQETSAAGVGDRTERYSACLPAWSSASRHNLDTSDLGLPQAADSLMALAGMALTDFEARQIAIARYDRLGFEAAAVTAMRMSGSAMIGGGRVKMRHATLRFGHAFAVVAVASQLPEWDLTTRRMSDAGPWDGLPVFSAWVSQPEEPAAETLNDGSEEDEEEAEDFDLPPEAEPKRSMLRRLAALFGR